MTSPPPSAAPAAAPMANVTVLAMKCLMQAKIACANTVHDLETIDGITDDWHEGSESLLLTALDLHLHCEAASKECHAIIDALDACLQGTMREAQLGFVEMECRQELATEEVEAIAELIKAVKDPEFGEDVLATTIELGQRCGRVTSRLGGLAKTIVKLKTLADEVSSQSTPATREQI